MDLKKKLFFFYENNLDQHLLTKRRPVARFLSENPGEHHALLFFSFFFFVLAYLRCGERPVSVVGPPAAVVDAQLPADREVAVHVGARAGRVAVVRLSEVEDDLARREKKKMERRSQ